jgi:YD repeat-containing protein
VTHNWATFSYANTTIQTNFTGLSVYGPANSTIKTLASVTLADGSHSDFTYTSWGQVWKISGYAADNHLLNYRTYNLPQTAASAHTDCPRFTERHDWAQYWNGDIDGTAAANEEAVTTFAVPVSDSWTMPDGTSQSGTRAQVTAPDGTSNKIYFIGTAGTSSGWRRSLPALVNTYDSANVLQRQAMTTWTQDNTAVSYELNPRVTETNIYDPAGNRAHTQTAYQQFTYANGTSCQFPRDVFEYAANATTILRSTRVDYHTSTSYTDRRILGLVAEKRFYEGDVNNGGTLMSKVGFYYDNENGASSIQGTDAPVQHDNTNYSASFITGRGNLSSVRRYDVTNTAVFTTTKTKFNTAGAIVSSRDALDHEVTVSYADSFSDGNNTRNTLAYPTTVIDPDGYSSTSKYHFDFGATTYVRTPQPNVTTNMAGPEQTLTFDVLGRLQQNTNVVNGAYTRFEYPTSQIRVDTYATIQEGLGEAHSFQITDGAGRVIATASDHPGSIGGFSGQRTVYDVKGRVIKTSNPTETSASGTPFQWTTAGDDATAGWIYTQQTYDWKGRPRVTTNQDGTTKTASYAGCGCAGGEVVTLTDEGTIDTGVTKKRQQKIYSDVLGRTVKTEILNWEAGSVYSATVNTYNARDQITQARQYQGPSTSGTYQDTSMTYDGYGRLQSKHVPEENTGTATTWTYNADDSVNTVTDARGAVTTMGYAGSNRGLVKSVTHTLTGSPQINVSYNYDAVGNRILMTDSLGTVSYGYDQLSRMTSETRTVTGVSSFALSYTYNLAGQLASYNTLGQSVSYTRDQVGSLTSVSSSGSTTPIVSNIKYRAWGGRNELTYGDNHTAVTQYNNRLLPTNYSLSNVMTRDYSYFADGRLKSSDLTQDGNFYRVYEYDHAGRLKSDSTPTNFAQNVTYDVWDNVTQSEGWHWSQIILASGTYANNRHSNWQYNAAGQVTVNDDNSFTYDAAGRMNTVWPQGFASAQQIIYDGDGQVVGGSGAFSKLRSTVLGGRVVAELFNTGQMSRSFVYAEGEEVVAFKYEGLDRVIWEHRDTAGQSVRQVEDTGIVVDAWDETASGSKIEKEDPYPSDPDFTGADTDGEYPHIGSIGRPMTGCIRDGVRIPDCSSIFEDMSSFDSFYQYCPVRYPIVATG